MIQEKKTNGHAGFLDWNGQSRSRWILILAGGEGVRMRSTIETCLGESRPKQFCAFTGERTMLQHTIDRAMTLAPEEHIVTVICEGQRRFVAEQNGHGRKHPGTVLEQPVNRGTAAAVFFGLSYISQCDPNATVLVLPSDHFAFPESQFLSQLEEALQYAERDSGNTLLLLGVEPDGPECDYGWIKTDNGRTKSHHGQNGSKIQAVESLHEKPGPEAACDLYLEGRLWNTMIMAARIDTFWKLLEKHLPSMLRDFRFLQPGLARIGSPRKPNPYSRPLFSNLGLGPGVVSNNEIHPEEAGMRIVPILGRYWCEAILRGMQAADFSADILQSETKDLRVLPLEKVHWSDWGRPDRVMASLRKIGVSPSTAFQDLEHALGR